MKQRKIGVLLVDDQVLFVESLKMVLETRSKDIRVVGIAYDGANVLQLVEEKRPDIVLMDIRMPKVDGVECTRQILEQFPETHIMILTTFNYDEYLFRALQYGAVGYLLKDIHPAYLLDAIHSVYNGGVLISPKVAGKLVSRSTDSSVWIKTDSGIVPQHSLLSDLSIRETEVLRQISRGYTNREIADTLCIAEQTVKNHVSMIYSKLGIKDRMQAYRLANEAGLRPKNDE